MIATRIVMGALTGALLLVPTVAASPDKGELCAVQTDDGSVYVSVFRNGNSPGPEAGASDLQLLTAGAWCVNEASVDGWMSGDKTLDSNEGQIPVCIVDSARSYVNYWVWASPDLFDFTTAMSVCREIQGRYRSSYIEWNTNDPVWVVEEDN